MIQLKKEKIFRVYFTWLGQDKGDYIDVYGDDISMACYNAVSIKIKAHHSNYNNTDICKVELIAQVQTTVEKEGIS